MNCSDSTPGPVIVKYEDDVPQISGKPCIDFQPDDRWQIKDDEDCNVDNPHKKSLVNETKKGKVYSDEKRPDATVNGDSCKIDSRVTVKEEAVENTSSDSSLTVKERPIVQSDKGSGVSQLNEEKPTRSPTNAIVALESEKMHDLSICPVKIEHSNDDTVNTRNESTPLDVKEVENKTVSEKAGENVASVARKEGKNAAALVKKGVENAAAMGKEEVDAAASMSKEEVDAAASVSKEEVDAAASMSKEEVDASMGKEEVDASMGKEEVDASMGKEEVDASSMGKEEVDAASMGKEEVDAASMGKEEVDAASMGKEEVDAAASMGKEEVDAAASMDKEEVDAAASMGKEEVDASASVPGKEAENTASVDGKEMGDTTLTNEPNVIPQVGEKSHVSITENSVTSEKDANSKSGGASCDESTEGNAGSTEKLANCDNEVAANMPSNKAKTGKPEHESGSSDKAAAEESPPKLENHLSLGENVPTDEDMPDISGSSNSGAVVDTVPKNSDSTLSESRKEAAQKQVGIESDLHTISSTTDSINKIFTKEQIKSQEKASHDVVLLNSLKGVLKAGQYKPVKFPHTGMLNLSENEVIIESPSLLVPLLIKEADVFPKADAGQSKTEDTSKKQTKPPVSKNFFESSVGKFLISLGMGRVEEWYHRDMKKAKLKHIKKYGPDEKVEEEFQMHHKEYLKAKEANSVFSFKLRRCQFCDFKSESLSVMEAHYLIPHLSPRKEYKCNFCVFFTRDPKEIIFHFEAMHGKKAVLDFIMPFHECPFCCFQSHLKTKVNAHINRCRKHFMPTHNQAPPFDFEFPGVTTKPVTMADVLAHRAIMNAAKSRPNQPVYTPPNAVPKGITVRNKLALINKISNQNSVNNVQGSTLVKQLVSQQQPKPIQPVSAATGIQLPPGLVITRPRANLPQVQNSVRLTAPRITTTTVRHQVNTRKLFYNSAESQLASSGISITPVTKVASQGVWTPNLNNAVVRPAMKNITVTPISSSSNQVVSQKPGPPQPVALFTNVAGSDSRNGSRGPVIMSVQSQAPRLSIGPKIGSPRIHIPYQRLNTPPSQVVKGSSGNTFVMCEICDSYIKDLEELRTHMNWVHKVKIHPKMLVSRPPLNCQKCQWRFFTDQGLERHLLGAHGLVTTNMQEMANKNQDGGRCIICGAVFTYKLVSHMTQVHKVTLKPAHLSYKCTVCTATFTLYRLFESHVYNVHSGSAKRPAEEQPASEPPSKKANITVVAPPEQKESVQEVVLEKCKTCDLEVEDLEEHLIKKHMQKCSVKVCHIEKCEKCLYSTDELLVIRMSDFGIEDDDDSEDEDEDEDSEITTVEIKSGETDSAPLESNTDKA